MRTSIRVLGTAAMLSLANVTARAQQDAGTGAAQSEMQKWIEATDAPWQAAYQRDVTDVHEAEAKKRMLQYLNLLEEAIVKVSKAGDLDGAVALRSEQKRFGDTQLFPGQDEPGDSAAVKQVRAAIRAQLAKLETDSAARAKALHAKYDQVLAQAQAQLTQRQRFDDALLVKAKRDQVAAAWTASGVAAAAEKTTPPGLLPPPKAPSASTQSAPSSKLKIVSAVYGADTRTVDITERVRKAYQSGEASLQLNTRLAADGRDPARGTRKHTVVTYEINGTVKTKTFGESQHLNFKKDLE